MPRRRSVKNCTGAYAAEPSSAWEENLYALWLDSLRRLDRPPAEGYFPEVMRRTPWRRKQLQTQLASWTELRHDALLYAKQSYTSMPSCGYPAAYVEPYPEFFARLALFAERARTLLSATEIPTTEDVELADALGRQRQREVSFFTEFSGTMRTLERLARKELRAEPFTEDESAFLRRTIDARGGGSGPPRYDGWYARLIYEGEPLDPGRMGILPSSWGCTTMALAGTMGMRSFTRMLPEGLTALPEVRAAITSSGETL